MESSALHAFIFFVGGLAIGVQIGVSRRVGDKSVWTQIIKKLAGHSSLIVTQRHINQSPHGLGQEIRALKVA